MTDPTCRCPARASPRAGGAAARSTPAERAGPGRPVRGAGERHRLALTPERAARIVRQSGIARWVGFLGVSIVVLFVIVYYFYELGVPGLAGRAG